MNTDCFELIIDGLMYDRDDSGDKQYYSLLEITEYIYIEKPFVSIIEVKHSAVHGNGVFAMQNISAEKVVSIYPAHNLILFDKNRVVSGNNFPVMSPKDTEYAMVINKTVGINATPDIAVDFFNGAYIKRCIEFC